MLIISAKQGAVTGAEDCAAAMQNMLLAAESLGIGSCWLGLPGGYEPQYAAVFGYKADPAQKEGPQRDRDVVNFIG